MAKSFAQCLSSIDANRAIPQDIKEYYKKLLQDYERIGRPAAEAVEELKTRTGREVMRRAKAVVATKRMIDDVNSRLPENWESKRRAGKILYNALYDSLAQKTGNERGVFNSIEWNRDALEQLLTGQLGEDFVRHFAPTAGSVWSNLKKELANDVRVLVGQGVKVDEMQHAYNRAVFAYINGMEPPENALTPTMLKLAKSQAEGWGKMERLSRSLLKNEGVDLGEIDNYFPHSHNFEKFLNVTKENYVLQAIEHIDMDKMGKESGLEGTDLTEHVKMLLRTTYEHAKRMDTGLYMSTRGKDGGTPYSGYTKRRVLHFTADGWWKYAERFADTDISTIMQNHVKSIALDISLAKFHPDPNQGVNELIQLGKSMNAALPPERRFSESVMEKNLRNVYDIILGRNNVVDTEWQLRRSKLMGLKFGSDSVRYLTNTGALSLLIDTASSVANLMTREASPRSYARYFRVLARNVRKHENNHVLSRDLAHSIDTFLNNVLSPAQPDEAIQYGWVHNWTQLSHRVSLLTKMTTANRNAASVIHNTNFVQQLQEGKLKFFKRYQIDEAEAERLKKFITKSPQEDGPGSDYDIIIPKQVFEEDPELGLKWMRMLRYEQEVSVVSRGGVAVQRLIKGGSEPGSFSRFGRMSMFQFKSAAFQQIMHLFQRLGWPLMFGGGSGGSILTHAGYKATASVGGAAMLYGAGWLYTQFSQIMNGKEPYPVDSKELALLALYKSGLMGSSEVAREFVHSSPREFSGTLAKIAMGATGDQIQSAVNMLHDAYKTSVDEGNVLPFAKQTGGKVAALAGDTIMPNVMGINLAVRRLWEDWMHDISNPEYERRIDGQVSRLESTDDDRTYWWSPNVGKYDAVPDNPEALLPGR